MGKKVGFCGQGVSNSKIIRGLVCIAGIVSASVVPDTYAQTKYDVFELEQENIPLKNLGKWLKQQHFERLCNILKQEGYGHIIKQNTTAADILQWYEGEINRLSRQLNNNLQTPKEQFYRNELESFRDKLHKPVIYSNWNWDQTVLDALHQAGFSSFEEQEEALKKTKRKIQPLKKDIRS